MATASAKTWLISALVAVVASLAVNGLEVTQLQIGVKFKPESCELKAHKGDLVSVHYRGLLSDGTEFENSYDREQPLDFKLGLGTVIKGWDQGILGMCVGEKRKLKIPAKLAYGNQSIPPRIPAGAALIFDTELVAVNVAQQRVRSLRHGEGFSEHGAGKHGLISRYLSTFKHLKIEGAENEAFGASGVTRAFTMWMLPFFYLGSSYL